MKKYSSKIKSMRNADLKLVRFKDDVDALISSEEFITVFKDYIENIALYRRSEGRAFRRSTEYAAIGIMDQNDMIQEAYLAFLEAYNNLDWSKVNNVHENERGALIWGFLKKSTTLNYEKSLRKKKDGVRTPERELFSDTVNTNMLTKIFDQLEIVFSRNVDEVAITKYETDLVGAFLDVHLDEFLDLTFKGERNKKGIERFVVKSFYGLDCVRMSAKEISEVLKISPSTVGVVRKRAVDSLKNELSKKIISDFLHEYRISTQADIEKYRN